MTLCPPTNLTKEQNLAFICGLIDGDGTIILSKQNRLELSIIGTGEIINWIKNIFDYLVLNKTKLLAKARQRLDRDSENHWVYKVTGFRAYSILSELMKLQVPRLDRKWNNVKLSCKPIYKCRYWYPF